MNSNDSTPRFAEQMTRLSLAAARSAYSEQIEAVHKKVREASAKGEFTAEASLDAYGTAGAAMISRLERVLRDDGLTVSSTHFNGIYSVTVNW